MKELLKTLNACDESIEWAGDKSWTEIYATCERADWLIWLFITTNPDDVRLRVLVAGLCSNTVRQLMQDERSVAAVDAAIAFGEGRISEEELNTACAAAAASYAACSARAALSAYSAAAYASSAAANTSAYSAYSAYSAAAYAYATDASESKHQAMMADIVRKHIPIDKFNISTP